MPIIVEILNKFSKYDLYKSSPKKRNGIIITNIRKSKFLMIKINFNFWGL